MRTYWNGEDCRARKVVVIVADTGTFPLYWAKEFVGQEREAVEVKQHGFTFYLDDVDGSGWAKVTNGFGSPNYPHRGLEVERVVRER
jgi:hypothetical protein